jgi:hypothetical protein
MELFKVISIICLLHLPTVITGKDFKTSEIEA